MSNSLKLSTLNILADMFCPNLWISLDVTDVGADTDYLLGMAYRLYVFNFGA